MTYRGHVKNGVVILEGDVALPEGSRVTVAVEPSGEQAVAPNGQTIWQKLQRMAAEAESQPTDLPEDLAAQHDHYLHGQAKRP